LTTVLEVLAIGIWDNGNNGIRNIKCKAPTRNPWLGYRKKLNICMTDSVIAVNMNLVYIHVRMTTS
jgi:hypothetical protein